MNNLVTWLQAQLDEDERVARDAGGEGWPNAPMLNERLTPDVIHARRHDPARVLAEVDAKRRILDLHRPVVLRRVVGGVGAPQDVTACGYDTDPDGAGWTDYPCETLRILALPYADRPGYRDEWRP